MIWKNRIRTSPFLRKLTHADGTEENVTIEDIDTNISQIGTPLDETTLNIQEQNIGTYGDDTYDNTATYSVNDIVIYRGLLYKCITAIETAENFNASHWQQFSLLDKIKASESNIATNTNNIATNTSNIATNTANIEALNNNKVSKVVTVSEYNTDLNDYTEEGTYYFSMDYVPLNIPTGVNGWLVVIPGEEGAIKQLWFRFGTNNSNDYGTYVRTYNATSSNWSDWQRYVVYEEVKDMLYFKAGEKYTFSNLSIVGDLTSSKTLIQFNIPFPKRADNVSIGSISLNGNIRHADGGYIASGVNFSTLGTITYTNRRKFS